MTGVSKGTVDMDSRSRLYTRSALRGFQISSNLYIQFISGFLFMRFLPLPDLELHLYVRFHYRPCEYP